MAHLRPRSKTVHVTTQKSKSAYSLAKNIGRQRAPQITGTGLGSRYLPNTNLHFVPKTPRPDPFQTVWIPTNAANCSFNDPNTELMVMYYSQQRNALNRAKKRRKCLGERLPVQLQDEPAYNLPLLELQRREVDAVRPRDPTPYVRRATWKTDRNTLEPASLIGKPTCSYAFDRGTDHRRFRFGIEPSSLAAYDPIHS